MPENSKPKSSLGDRMSDFQFEVKDAKGKPKFEISSTDKAADKPEKKPDQ